MRYTLDIRKTSGTFTGCGLDNFRLTPAMSDIAVLEFQPQTPANSACAFSGRGPPYIGAALGIREIVDAR
jgi:hypothetical protein